MFKHLTSKAVAAEASISPTIISSVKKYEKQHKNSRLVRWLVRLFRAIYPVFAKAMVITLSSILVFIYLSLTVIIPVIYMLLSIAATSAIVTGVGKGWEGWLIEHWDSSILYRLNNAIDIRILSFIYIAIPMIIAGGLLISFLAVIAIFYRNSLYGQ